jgi:hypothetical protein
MLKSKNQGVLFEVKKMSNAQFNALLRFECFYHVKVNWESIRGAVSPYDEAYKKIAALIRAAQEGKIVKRAKPANYYAKKKAALEVLAARQKRGSLVSPSINEERNVTKISRNDAEGKVPFLELTMKNGYLELSKKK